jgi:hypothetical protein
MGRILNVSVQLRLPGAPLLMRMGMSMLRSLLISLP